MYQYIEKEEKHYRFRLRENKKLLQKYFNFKRYGGESFALEAALQYREKIFKNRRMLTYDFVEWLSLFILEKQIKAKDLTSEEVLEEIKTQYLYWESRKPDKYLPL